MNYGAVAVMSGKEAWCVTVTVLEQPGMIMLSSFRQSEQTVYQYFLAF